MIFDDPKTNGATKRLRWACAHDFPNEMENEPCDIGAFTNGAFFDTIRRKIDPEERPDKYSFLNMEIGPAEMLLAPREMMEKDTDSANEHIKTAICST